MAKIASTYQPSEIEEKWYSYWEKQNYFHSEVDDREAYTIVIPPPNVTGMLHMGHMLNNTIQDILIRRARLQGKNACWVPGTDHASIATEAKVVNMLADKGIKKEDLSREEFLQYAFQWKEEYGGIILKQLRRLGASCDWQRTRFTMEESLSNAVKLVFVDLFEKGLIYRGMRMVNWDPKAKTALSDEEVNHKEQQSNLYHIRYDVEGSNESIVIATTRPETILADSAIAFNPNDPRYVHFKGKRAIIPIANRSIPIIYDDYVEMEFGTGALKITPAHDPNDNELGSKHQLEIIDMLNEDGTINEKGLHYQGVDRFEARKAIVNELKESGHLVDVEQIVNKVGYSERTDVIIEPRLTYQWFLDMPSLAKPALDAVVNGDINFYPKNLINTYKYWMENIQNWTISRQLWWGQQIPAYFYGEQDGEVVAALTIEEALEKAKKKSGNDQLTEKDLRQDPDVVDTWFSSWLWPISVFDGFQKENEHAQKELAYYYPTATLVTAPDIIFFWVARMIMAGLEYEHKIPFKDVYFTGVVRDSQRRKMSKSLGNSPDPIELINQYGADGVRVGMLLAAPAGNDLLFDEKLCEQGRNFTTKMWNALRLINMWEVEDREDAQSQPAIDWFSEKLNDAKTSLEQSYSNFRISEALMTNYSLFWDDFSSWYLEFIKPNYGSKIARSTLNQTIEFFQELMQLLHPFMPFITEEIWHQLKPREAGDDIIVSTYSEFADPDSKRLQEGEQLKEMITAIREVRAKNQLKNKDQIEVYVLADDASFITKYRELIQKMTNSSSIEIVDGQVENTQPISLKGHQLYIDTGMHIDVEAEQERIQKEIEYQKGFLMSVDKKLSNERFVSNAPEQVIEKERQKKADAEQKIHALQEQLENLS